MEKYICCHISVYHSTTRTHDDNTQHTLRTVGHESVDLAVYACTSTVAESIIPCGRLDINMSFDHLQPCGEHKHIRETNIVCAYC